MQISTNKNLITITSIPETGYLYVHTIQKITTTESLFETSFITESTSTYELTTDGYYIITEMKLPNTVTVGEYYILNDVIIDPNGDEISAEELLNVDPEGTNIERSDVDYFIYYYLQTYYIDALTSKFDKYVCSCSCMSKQDKITIDTLTMGLDMIKSLIGYSQYYEAQRIVEQLSTCVGIDNTNCNCHGG